MASKVSRVKATKSPALTISRIALHADQLVYVAQANRAIRYPNGERSAIAYIGTTKNGIARIASSAAWKARDILSRHGVNHLEFLRDYRLDEGAARPILRSKCRTNAHLGQNPNGTTPREISNTIYSSDSGFQSLPPQGAGS